MLNLIKNCRKHKVTFRLESNNKKICTVKFTDKEFNLIKLSAQIQNITLQQFFDNLIESLKQDVQKNN